MKDGTTKEKESRCAKIVITKMNKIKSFPKIFSIGTNYIVDIFNEPVEITEKIDGSQFVFGKIDGELQIRSKGAQIYENGSNGMFTTAVQYVSVMKEYIPENTIFYCEYLQKPKHNVLKYDRVPKNNLILFGVSDVSDKFITEHESLKKYADMISIECVPLVFSGKIEKPEDIFDLIKRESVLGGVSVEGIVVKNYQRPFLFGGVPMPLMSGKYVSEGFKEIHQKDWSKENTAKGKYQVYKDGFRSDARWEKAVQHLREKGLLDNSPKDIGILMKEIEADIIEEEKENIKEFLWKEFSGDLLRSARAGFPEWYKKRLVENSF